MNTDQIAAEARTKFFEAWELKGNAYQKNLAFQLLDEIIVAAIKAAISKDREENLSFLELDHIRRMRGLQEWTPVFEENSSCWYVCKEKTGEPAIEYPFDSRDAAFKIADAHNHNTTSAHTSEIDYDNLVRDAMKWRHQQAHASEFKPDPTSFAGHTVIKNDP